MSLPPGMAGVRFALPLVSGHFIRRLNRFAALVRVKGRDELVHVRNSGRLRELLVPGRPVFLEPAHREGRRTRFTLLEHLIAACGQGLEAVVLFVIQRTDATALAPNRRTDPAFAAALTRRGGPACGSGR